MGLETFESCEIGGVSCQLGGALSSLEFEPGADPQKIEDAQPALESGDPSGGQSVVGADPVVAEDLGRGVADEEPAPVAEPFGDCVGVRRQDLEVLGRQQVADPDGGVDVGGDDGETVFERCEATSRVGRSTSCFSSSASTRSASGDDGVTRTGRASGSCSAWARRSAATVAGSAVSSASTTSSDGPGQHVDAHVAGDELLGGGDPAVARAHHDVAGGHRTGAVGERGDGLGAADREHAVGAGDRGRGQGHRPRVAARPPRPRATPATRAVTAVISTEEGSG